MKERNIATILIILGLIIVVTTSIIKIREDVLVQSSVNGTDSNNRSMFWFLMGWFGGGIVGAVGWLMRRAEKDLVELNESQLKITKELKKAKQVERNQDEFKAFLSDFNDDERLIIEHIHTQEGILESTLGFRTEFSKTKLSLILKDLEKRDIISKMPHKKTNKLYLKKLSN